jgi:hypothetical protein
MKIYIRSFKYLIAFWAVFLSGFLVIFQNSSAGWAGVFACATVCGFPVAGGVEKGKNVFKEFAWCHDGFPPIIRISLMRYNDSAFYGA